MSANITITHSESDTRGRYVARVEGYDATGELTYSRLSPEKIIADHTGVDDSLRGMGVGVALVEKMVADARDEGFKVVPLCPFVRAQVARHPEWSDVFED